MSLFWQWTEYMAWSYEIIMELKNCCCIVMPQLLWFHSSTHYPCVCVQSTVSHIKYSTYSDVQHIILENDNKCLIKCALICLFIFVAFKKLCVCVRKNEGEKERYSIHCFTFQLSVITSVGQADISSRTPSGSYIWVSQAQVRGQAFAASQVHC